MARRPAAAPAPTELREGLWMLAVPAPVRALGYTLVYAFEADDGVYLVDAGWGHDAGMDGLEAGLRAAGYRVADVRGIAATHVHPDHYGLAGRVRDQSGAWLALHPADAAFVRFWYGGTEDRLRLDRATLADHGVPAAEIDAVADASLADGDYGPPHAPDRLITDREVLWFGRRRLVALWTPGHSPGHLAFYLPDERLLLSGDQVLPTLTPGISYHPCLGGDPLGDFFRSLDTLTLDDVELVLPAHEQPFDALRPRLDELRRYHQRRLSQVSAGVTSGAGTAWDIARGVEWAKPWADLRWTFRRLALQETMAHLCALEACGAVERSDAAPHRWTSRRDMLTKGA